jgi:hypothetical protein
VRRWGILGAIAGAVCAATFVNCGDGEGGPLPDLPEQCGLQCPEEGILEGNSKISGLVEIDAFFGAVIDLRASTESVRDGIDAELSVVALSLGLDADADAQAVADTAELYIGIHTDGGLKLEMSEPQCQASVEVAATAAAECDVDVDPGAINVECAGSCQVEAGAAVDCGADATLICKGGAPNFACAGSCTGECELTAAATCDGVCRGSCTGNCSVTDSMGNCAGGCQGDCQGTCELKAGGNCSGECRGTCEYEAGGGMCDASVEARCESDAGASVECEGTCRGEAEAPEVSAECEATVKAKADASLDCSPPQVTATWQWSAATAGDAMAQAEFKAWVRIISGAAAAMRSKGVKGDILLNGFVAMSESADGAVTAAAEAALDGNINAIIGAGCALDELPNAATTLQASGALLGEALVDAAAVLTSLGA